MELISTPPPGLPLSYYDIPDFFRAIFSTSLGSLPKRELVYPYPAVMVRTNLGIDVQRKCQDLWSRFPDQVRMIGPLARYSGEKAWYELYNFFDAIDLWIETPAFCFSVIHRLAGKFSIPPIAIFALKDHDCTNTLQVLPFIALKLPEYDDLTLT